MTDPRMTGTKTCSKCKKDLPVICFPALKKSSDGLYSWCRDCDREASSRNRRLHGIKKGKQDNRGAAIVVLDKLDRGLIS